jgi:hypothetical protein
LLFKCAKAQAVHLFYVCGQEKGAGCCTNERKKVIFLSAWTGRPILIKLQMF